MDESPLQGGVGGAILEREEFIEQVKNDHLRTCRPVSDIPALRQLAARPTVEAILAAVNVELGVSDKDARRIGLHLSHTLCDLPLRQLGEIFGLRETALCEASRRMRRKITVNPALSEIFARISARVKS